MSRTRKGAFAPFLVPGGVAAIPRFDSRIHRHLAVEPIRPVLRMAARPCSNRSHREAGPCVSWTGPATAHLTLNLATGAVGSNHPG